MPSLVSAARRPAATRRIPLRLLRFLFTASAIRRQRLRLNDLDEAMLRDIGITRAEAEAEARRPLWDVAPHWRTRDWSL